MFEMIVNQLIWNVLVRIPHIGIIKYRIPWAAFFMSKAREIYCGFAAISIPYIIDYIISVRVVGKIDGNLHSEVRIIIFGVSRDRIIPKSLEFMVNAR